MVLTMFHYILNFKGVADMLFCSLRVVQTLWKERILYEKL